MQVGGKSELHLRVVQKPRKLKSDTFASVAACKPQKQTFFAFLEQMQMRKKRLGNSIKAAEARFFDSRTIQSSLRFRLAVCKIAQLVCCSFACCRECANRDASVAVCSDFRPLISSSSLAVENRLHDATNAQTSAHCSRFCRTETKQSSFVNGRSIRSPFAAAE